MVIFTHNSKIPASDDPAATPPVASLLYATTRDSVSKYSGYGLISRDMPLGLTPSYGGSGNNPNALIHNKNYNY